MGRLFSISTAMVLLFTLLTVPVGGQQQPIRSAISASRSDKLIRQLRLNDSSVAAGEHNQQILQAALNDIAGGSGMTLPAGCIAVAGEPTEVGGIRALLHTPQAKRGGIIEGQGESCVTKVNAGDQRFEGVYTALVYVGSEPNEPTALLALPSGRDFVVQNLSFHGRPFLREDKYANTTALAVVRGPNGIGSGHHKFQNLTFDKWDVGVQFGVNIGDANNDVCFVQRPSFKNCRVATQLNAHMVLGNTFVYPVYEHGVDIAFQVHAGGTLSVWGGFIAHHQEAFLQIHDSGSNTGRYQVHGLVHHGIDGKRKTTFVSMPGEELRPCTITFENLDCKPQYYKPGDVMFEIDGPTTLYLDKCYGLQRGTILLRSSGVDNKYQPFVDVSRCTLVGGYPDSVADLINPESTGNYHWKGTANRRFYTRDNMPIADEANY